MEEKERYMGQDSLYGTNGQSAESYDTQTDMDYGQQTGGNYATGNQMNTGYDVRQMNGNQMNTDYDKQQSNDYHGNQMNTSYDGQNDGRYGNQNYGAQGSPQYSYGTNMRKEPDPGNGFGIASLILGVVSFLLFCTCMNWITGILAIIFGIIQIAKGGQKGLAIGGIVTSAVSMLLCLILYFFVGVASYKDYYYDYYNYNSYEEAPYQEMYPAEPDQEPFKAL